MTAFGADRLSAMNKLQETGDAKKKEEEAAAEAAAAEKHEREAEKEVVLKRLETCTAELTTAKEEAGEAGEALIGVEKFEAEHGENIDPAAAEEMQAYKLEIAEAFQTYEDKKAEVAGIEAELAVLNTEGALSAETAEEVAVESTESASTETSEETTEEASSEETSDEEISENTSKESVSEEGEAKLVEEESNKESQGEMDLEEMEKSRLEKEAEVEKMRWEINSLKADFKKINKEYRELKKTDPEAAEALKNEAEAEGGVLKTLNDSVNKRNETHEEIERIKINVAEKKIDSALQTMEGMQPPEEPHSGTSARYSRELAKVFAKLNSQMDVLSEGKDAEKLELTGEKIAERIREKMVEFIDNSKDVDNFNPARGSASATMAEGFYTLNKVSPTAFEDQAAIVLEGNAEDLKDMSPDEIRKALYTNRTVYKALGPMYDKLANGEEVSENAKAALRKILPLLRASDNSKIMGASDAGTTRFLTDGFIYHNSGRSFDKEEEKKEYANKVRATLEKIENE